MAPQMSVWGIDMAKLVCHVVGMDDAGAVVVWKRLARSEWLAFTQTSIVVIWGSSRCYTPLLGK
jgi:hypothetical protein